MITPIDPRLPDPAVCEQARRSRDPRFDGLFFTAVPSTGIYCRPVCPAPAARKVRYFVSAPAAEAAGFRPCLRCRPELSPAEGSWRRGDAVVARALKLIEQGAFTGASLATLAGQLSVSERQLRRLFVERLGAPPIAVHSTRRLLFAKQLLTETKLPITEIALAAGFRSLRRFNQVFRDAYRMSPRALRKERSTARGDVLTLRLGYRPPYDFQGLLAFLRARALTGIEVVGADSYTRTIAHDATDAGTIAWLRVEPWGSDAHALKLEVHGVAPTRLLDVVRRVRRMFDLDADPQAIAEVLGADPQLRPLVRKDPGLRLPSGWDGFEVAVRAIIGQQVSVAAARTVCTRVAHRFGTHTSEMPLPGLTHVFPPADALVHADLSSVGLTQGRARTITTMARAYIDGQVDFNEERTLESFVGCWMGIPGIGPWTAHYLAMRALGHPDAFPVEDLVLRRAASVDEALLSPRTLASLAERWRPWRAYAAMLLWREAATAVTARRRSSTMQSRTSASVPTSLDTEVAP